MCPGRYSGRFVAGSVTVFGAGAGDDPTTSTILDAQSIGRTLSLNQSGTTVLANLRITGGAAGASMGGGLYGQQTDLTLNDCTITGNSADYGGGLYLNGGRLQGSNTIVTNNEATYAGGGASVAQNFTGSISNWKISDNKALHSPGPARGGGITVEAGAELTVSRSEISRNTATTGGGGVLVYISPSKLTLDSASRISNNVVNTTNQDRGGGVLTMHGGVARLNGATLSGNTPDNTNNVG